MASVRERVSDSGVTSFQVQYRHQGRQQSRTFSQRKPAEDLALLMNQLGVARALKVMAESDPRRKRGITLDEVAEKWFAFKARDLSKRGLEDYRRDYRNWIQPFFGQHEAASIDELDVQEWVDRDLTPLDAKTIASRHALLHGMMKWAAAKKRGLIPHNPCTETDLPKRSKKPPKGLRLPEWAALLEAAYRINPDAADLILFMGSTGWRIGEATALQVGAVDDTGSTMYVDVSHVNRKGEGLVEGAKSDAGFRRIRMFPECAAMLRRRIVGKGPGDLVFTNPQSPTGLWEPSTFRNRWWKKAVVAAGLEQRKPTPHWLRHTHVFICHAAGMPLPEIQRRIGHADIRTTINVYGRLIDDTSDEVADRADALLSGRVPAVVQGQVIAELD